MSKLSEEYLHHIYDETVYLIKCSSGVEEKKFARDETLQKAFARSLEIIGEATKNISPDFKESHGDVDWKSIAGMQDRLVHHYFGIDLEIVWDVIKNEIPKLNKQIKEILQDLKNNTSVLQ